jgi:hypothetical protein
MQPACELAYGWCGRGRNEDRCRPSHAVILLPLGSLRACEGWFETIAGCRRGVGAAATQPCRSAKLSLRIKRTTARECARVLARVAQPVGDPGAMCRRRPGEPAYLSSLYSPAVLQQIRRSSDRLGRYGIGGYYAKYIRRLMSNRYCATADMPE